MDLHEDTVFGNLLLLSFLSLTVEEAEMVRNWRNHETVRKWMHNSDEISKEEHREFIEELRFDPENFFWVVKENVKHYLGTIYLNRVDFKNKNAYLGVYANPHCRVPGAGQALINSLKRVAFEIAHLHTLKLEVIETNGRALDFYKKSGFAEEGRLREFVYKDERWHDVIVMGIINKDDGN